jgi:hypothetical protein
MFRGVELFGLWKEEILRPDEGAVSRGELCATTNFEGGCTVACWEEARKFEVCAMELTHAGTCFCVVGCRPCGSCSCVEEGTVVPVRPRANGS